MALGEPAKRRAMRAALEAAVLHRPHPNPRVGAVVFDAEDRQISVGAHVESGRPHAEAIAIEAAGERAVGGTLVVTLEPHDHQGRTPPCTEAVIRSGISRVVVGAIDPDQRVRGRGIARLRSAGIDVEFGVLSDEVEAADPGYFHHRRTGRARVTLKSASTLDGQTAAIDATSQWITGTEARADAHLLRAEHDAVMVGAGTVLADDPALTVRVGDPVRQPRPVVIAGTRPLPAGATLWTRSPLVASAVPLPGVQHQIVAPGRSGRVDLVEVLRRLPEHGILDVLAEGGAGLAAGLWDADVVDAGVTYLAAKLAGGVGRSVFDRPFPTLAESRPITIDSVVAVGDDLRVDWRPSRPAESELFGGPERSDDQGSRR